MGFVFVAGPVGAQSANSAEHQGSDAAPTGEVDPAVEEAVRRAQEAFGQAGSQLEEGLRALGEAGRRSWENHAPDLRERAEEALEATRGFLEELGDALEERDRSWREPAPEQPDFSRDRQGYDGYI